MTDAVFSFRFFIATFGCKVSQYESQALREHWTRLGGRETDDAALADVLLIASCAVTAEAVADARQTARKWGAQFRPPALWSRAARLRPRQAIFSAGRGRRGASDS